MLLMGADVWMLMDCEPLSSVDHVNRGGGLWCRFVGGVWRGYHPFFSRCVEPCRTEGVVKRVHLEDDVALQAIPSYTGEKYVEWVQEFFLHIFNLLIGPYTSRPVLRLPRRSSSDVASMA